MDQQPSPKIGDNIPPADENWLSAFQRELERNTEDIGARIRDHQVGLARVPEEIDEGTEALATDFVRQVKQTLKDAEDLRKETKRPFDERGKAIQEHFRVLVGPAANMLEQVLGRLSRYQRAKEARVRAEAEARRREAEAEERRKREEAERLQREAEEKARAAHDEKARAEAAARFDEAARAGQAAEQAAEQAKQAEKEQTGPVHLKGDYGSTGFTRDHWACEITDSDALPAGILWRYVDDGCREKALRAAVKDGLREIDGARIWEEDKIVVRG